MPYETPPVEWGDSTQLGIGDRIMVGGYPLGTDMFTVTESNRGIIQPTFYDGIISAILPATTETETRLLQISIAAHGGMSGGAAFDPISGKILGMITSGFTGDDGNALPITYAIPSEVIVPYLQVISFQAGSEEF
jgi:S1-C subfamily serine protease